MDAFSIPYTGPYPVEGKCLICMDELSNFDFGLLVARCTNGHVFHNLCLDKWVNCSAMDNANLCPHDRERLCDPRPRMHLGFLVPPPEPSDIDDEEEDEGSIMDADESDYEGFDADAEGEDEDLFSMDVDEEEEADCVPRCEAAGSIFFQYQLNGVDFLYPF
ncbi:hypothetical protein BU23DRAFT_200094 [Bimuria novae-zelandiae CBS 107.79]|uniref:RING-type domain-containing protein n=1 Tax=Bimuria novae-zelandiae CBS 107.79 TaxID=1447943 RepID=A0A6A5V7U0_9PLEO|nr:hypothetical protein BU23DRAFT_200094 [Bimuria novae-zelandiae CBS 107.79]